MKFAHRLNEQIDDHMDSHCLKMKETVNEIGKKIVLSEALQRITIHLILLAISRGHALLEASPGVAKTLLAQCISEVIGGNNIIYQFHQDMLPGDLLGDTDYILDPNSSEDPLRFVYVPGIIPPEGFNIFLADEINRATTKALSPLLRLMQEGQIITKEGVRAMPEICMVIGTQNPLDREVYELPVAVRDRFTSKIIVPYPDTETFGSVLKRGRLNRRQKQEKLDMKMDTGDLLAIRNDMYEFYEQAIPPQGWHEYGGERYVTAMYHWFLQAPYCKKYRDQLLCVPVGTGEEQGAVSPRAFESIVELAKVLAVFFPSDDQSYFYMPEHVQRVVYQCISHRLWFYPGITKDEQIKLSHQIVDDCLNDIWKGTSNNNDGGPVIRNGNIHWRPKSQEELTWTLPCSVPVEESLSDN